MTIEATEVKEEAIAEIVAMNSFYPLKKGQTVDDLPVSPNAFYVPAQEGFYLRKPTALGIGTIKMASMPKSLGEMGYPKGCFEWSAPVVPPELCSQIFDFFKRIWDKHSAEAEVILTARVEKDEKGLPKITEWRVFVPTQKVSGGGVESVYDPEHIAKGHQVVGTMHSHCNFSAYHSGTDTNDARGMDGLHITIGHVDKKNPEVACMVSVNGMQVEYKWSTVADFSKLGIATAPAWWDNYVIPTKDLQTDHRPKGWSNFDKFKPVGSGNSGRSDHAWGSEDYGAYGQYKGFGGYNHMGGYGGYPDSKRSENTPTIKTLKDLKDEKEDNDKNFALLPADTKKLREQSTDDRTYTVEELEELFDRGDDYWEDRLSDKTRNFLFNNDLLSDDDVDDIVKHGASSDTYLRTLMLHKLRAIKTVLEGLGTKVVFTTVETVKEEKKSKKGKKGKTNGKR